MFRCFLSDDERDSEVMRNFCLAVNIRCSKVFRGLVSCECKVE